MPLNDSKTVAREATRAFLEDSDQVDELLETLADGLSLRALCTQYGLVYSTTMRWLAKHRAADYEAARIVRADSAIEEMESIERQLEAGDIDFNTARELMKSKQWRAERLNGVRYGQRQSIDMQVTDKTKLHLEALRELSRRPPEMIIKDERTNPQLTHEPAQALPAPLPAVVDAEFKDA